MPNHSAIFCNHLASKNPKCYGGRPEQSKNCLQVENTSFMVFFNIMEKTLPQNNNTNKSYVLRGILKPLSL